MIIEIYKDRLYKHDLMATYESNIVPDIGEFVELNDHTYRVISRAYNYGKNKVFVVVKMVSYMPLPV